MKCGKRYNALIDVVNIKDYWIKFIKSPNGYYIQHENGLYWNSTKGRLIEEKTKKDATEYNMFSISNKLLLEVSKTKNAISLYKGISEGKELVQSEGYSIEDGKNKDNFKFLTIEHTNKKGDNLKNLFIPDENSQYVLNIHNYNLNLIPGKKILKGDELITTFPMEDFAKDEEYTTLKMFGTKKESVCFRQTLFKIKLSYYTDITNPYFKNYYHIITPIDSTEQLSSPIGIKQNGNNYLFKNLKPYVMFDKGDDYSHIVIEKTDNGMYNIYSNVKNKKYFLSADSFKENEYMKFKENEILEYDIIPKKQITESFTSTNSVYLTIPLVLCIVLVILLIILICHFSIPKNKIKSFCNRIYKIFIP